MSSFGFDLSSFGAKDVCVECQIVISAERQDLVVKEVPGPHHEGQSVQSEG